MAHVDETFAAMREAGVDRRDPKAQVTLAWRDATAQLRAALERAYPPTFFDSLEAVKQGKRSGLDEVIDFLEADPWFFRSGYVKATALRAIKRVPLEPDEAERLRRVILDIVERRDRREFRDYCRLARHLATPGFRSKVEERVTSADPAVARRARWVLAALDTAM